MFVTDTYYSLELGTEIIQFEDQDGRTDLWSSKTEICQESNKAEMKDKFRSLKLNCPLLPSLPRGTDKNIKSLKHLPEKLNLAMDF